MDFLNSVDGLVNLTIPVLETVPVLRAILGSILVFFVPGFAWTLLLFRNINRLERLALSVAISIALVTLCILVINRVFDVPFTDTTSLVVILVLTAVPIGILYGIRLLIYIIKKSK